MAMDELEREHMRRKMARRMRAFQGVANQVTCVSGHWSQEQHICELCDRKHSHEVIVTKNRAGKKMKVDSQCLTEMVRFQVTDVEDLSRWLEKMKALKVEAQQRELENKSKQEEQRRRYERRVIVRKRAPHTEV